MQLPGPVRAAIGLAANVADEARHLPDRAIELPMLAVSTVLQVSLRAQQRYAMLTARGDEVLGGHPGDEPPAWATFDDPVDLAPSPDDPTPGDLTAGDPAPDNPALDNPAPGDSSRASAILDEIFGSLDAAPAQDDTPVRTGPPRTGPPRAAPPRKAPGKRAPAKKAPARKPAAPKPAADRTPDAPDTSDAPDTPDAGKRVSKPRHTAPSKFDDVDD